MSCASQEEKRLAEIREFLGDLFIGAEGFMTFWTLQDKKSSYFLPSRNDEAAEWVNGQAETETKDVYVGIGTRDMNLGAERRCRFRRTRPPVPVQLGQRHGEFGHLCSGEQRRA